MARVIPAPFGFTPEQREQYDSLVPAVPEEVVAQIVREFRRADLEDDLLQEAYLGTAKGVRTFDATKGKLRPWVFFSALHAAQAVLRKEKRQSRVVARMWDGLIELCKSTHHTPAVIGSREGDRAALTEFCSRAVASAVVGVAVLEVPAGGGENEVVERLTAARCADGLARAVGELSDRHHELLRLCFADDQTVKDAAEVRGERGYRAELRELHRATDLLAARLRGMGFHERPPFPPEAAGTILRESSALPAKP